MTPKVMTHSEGMVSVEAEELTPSAASIEFVKNSELYRELVSLIGEEHANATVTSGAPVLPTEAAAEPDVSAATTEPIAATEDH